MPDNSISWPVIILVAVGTLLLIILLVRKNMKDKRQLEKKLDNEYDSFVPMKHETEEDDFNDE